MDSSYLRKQLSGNEFSTSDLFEQSSRAAPIEEAHQHGPELFLEPVDGGRRLLKDEDYIHHSKLVFEIDQDDEFASLASIKTVEDLGFAAWLQGSDCLKDQSTLDFDAKSDAGRQNALTGIGSFAAFPHLDSSASSKDVENYLDVEAVGENLRDSSQVSKANNSRFLPLNKLCEIVSNDVIRRLLRNVCPDIDGEELEERIQQVCGRGVTFATRRKIFSILILIGKVESILGFINAEICDADLPLKLEWKDRRYSIKKRGDVPLASTSTYFRNWLRRDFEAFEDKQSWMLAPYFELGDDKLCFYKLDHNQIVLPFTEYEPKSQGGQARVFKVKIHKAHHSFRPSENFPDSDPFFAVKEIHSTNAEDFKKEVEVLERFSGENEAHTHLIRLLLTYRHAQKYYLLFHWANGNLREFWRQHPNPLMSVESVQWLITQCRGIATGLRKIHHANTWPKKSLESNTETEKDWGRHGDIKPENILWFAHPQHRLVISDFGLTRYHSSHSRSNVPYANIPGFSKTYRPPEFELENTISQRYDIWTLGCLYLEFLSWFLLGDFHTQKTFSQSRLDDVDNTFGGDFREDKFFNLYFHDGKVYTARLKESVKKWINDLHALPTCSNFFHMFLDMIERYLLVPEVKDRWDCARVCAELEKMFDECMNPDYCIAGNPREPITAQGTPRETFGELRGPEFRDEPQTTFPSSHLGVPGHSPDTSGVRENSAYFPETSGEDKIERLSPADSTSQPSSVCTHYKVDDTVEHFLDLTRSITASHKAEINNLNGETSSIASQAFKEPNIADERGNLPRLDTGEEGPNQDSSLALGMAIRFEEDQDPAPTAQHHSSQGTHVQKISKRPAEVSRDLPGPSNAEVLVREMPDQRNTPLGRPVELLPAPHNATEQDKIQTEAVRPEAQKPASRKDGPRVRKPPSVQSRIKDLITAWSNPLHKHHALYLRYNLCSIMAELKGLVPGTLRIELENKHTISNIFKGIVEDLTQERWQWWPFKPRERLLLHGESRMLWLCSCGTMRSLIVPSPFAAFISRLVSQAHPPKGNLGESNELGFLSGGYSTSSINPALPIPRQAQPSIGMRAIFSSPSSSGNGTAISIDPSHQRTFHIELVVSSGRTYALSQIEIQTGQNSGYLLTDARFFKQLRLDYKRLRGFFLARFSIWIYSHCDFYVFEKWEEFAYAPKKPDFPKTDDMNYEYKPKPMNCIPPISGHEFEMRFYACQEPCRNLLHRCRLIQCRKFCKHTSQALDVLPKRLAALEEGSPVRLHFWGIFARERPSFFRFFFYCFFCIFWTLGFMIWWLLPRNHPADLQNATTPLAIMVTVISLCLAAFMVNVKGMRT